MRSVLGFEPAYTTAEAFEDFGHDLGRGPGLREQALAGLADRLPPAVEEADRG